MSYKFYYKTPWFCYDVRIFCCFPAEITQGFLSRCLKCSDKPQSNYVKSNYQKHIKIFSLKMVGITFIVILACTYLVQSFPQNTPKNGLDITTPLVPKVISAASPIFNQNDDQIKVISISFSIFWTL